MPKTATIIPTGYNFGQGGYTSFHKIQLPGLGTIPSSTSTKADDHAVNFRKGILFYFGHLELPGIEYKDVKGVYDGIKSKVKDVQSAVQEAKQSDWGRNQEVKTISEAVTDALGTAQGKAPAWLQQVSSEAASRISHIVPDVVSGLLSEVGKLGVPVAGNIKAAGAALVSAIIKTHKYWSTRGLDEALRSGEPKVIIEALRREIGKEAVQKFAETIYESAKAVAGALTGGVAVAIAKIVDTVAAFLKYIWKLYKKVRDYLALSKFFDECSRKFSANDSVIFSPSKFRTWLSDWIGELPIIAPHCMASPMCGSYFGFLSTLIEGKNLETAYGKFQSLKDPAREFVKGYDLEFTSSDPMVEMSLKVIQKGGIDMTDGAAAQSVGWFRRTYMKYGSKIGITKNTLYS